MINNTHPHKERAIQQGSRSGVNVQILRSIQRGIYLGICTENGKVVNQTLNPMGQ